MNKLMVIFFLILSMVTNAQQRDVEVVQFDRIQEILSKQDKNVTVINFWATWCGPCIKELPYFNEVNQSMDEGLNLYLVSLDFADNLERVEEFTEERKLNGSVLLLNNLDYDSWINKIDPAWSGAIPATLFINTSTGERIFVERELTKEEIEKNILSLKN
jgi:thiol-disulfide isomerase/thioredoxin